MKKVVMTDGERQRTTVLSDGIGGNQAGGLRTSSLWIEKMLGVGESLSLQMRDHKYSGFYNMINTLNQS